MSENIVQYVVAASGGDTDAMAKLYSKTLKASYYLASALCADDRAVEITKEAYAKAFCSIDKLKKPEAFEIWMKQNVASVYKEKQKLYLPMLRRVLKKIHRSFCLKMHLKIPNLAKRF